VTKQAKEKFSYRTWLNDLRAGDKVKIANCRHNKCNCETLEVDSIVPMFNNSEVAIVVREGCSTHYYSKDNGRELGSRKGTYKDGSIGPFTPEDKAAIEAQILKKAQDEEKSKLSKDLEKLLVENNLDPEQDRGNLAYYLSQNLDIHAIKRAIKKQNRLR
jgi:hypothetical protein